MYPQVNRPEKQTSTGELKLRQSQEVRKDHPRQIHGRKTTSSQVLGALAMIDDGELDWLGILVSQVPEELPFV